MDLAVIIWLVLLVVFLAAEAATVTMISLWFAAGALAALVVALFHGALWLQIAVFVVVSAVLLAALRPLSRRLVAPRAVKTNVDAVIGAEGLVTEAIDNVTAQGQVKLGAMVWSARSTSGDPIPVGQRIKADRVEGVKVYVSPAEVSVV
ncbi:MAG: NfeD family protein [Eubacteriales bacterium]|nr:NfeD family protein [Eubacteriales bacterium]